MKASNAIPFSQRPGRHERHFRRRLDNPLMPRPLRGYSDKDLLEVQRLDHEELVAFIEELKQLVVRAIELPPNADSETVLGLKGQLERAYATSAALADEQSAHQAALAELIEVIMRVVRRHAEGDSLAAAELAQEDAARRVHFSLLQQPLVADLLHPHSLIQADELAAVLLAEPEPGLLAALELFDPVQLGEILRQADALLGQGASQAQQARLQRIQQWLETCTKAST
ncbi:MAG: hypothetical protein H7842_07795 [Gammaproteobacteria bacterium SHHR-1]|uniref:hypothetical protein n=1 Tax=Magnetovirga frankeli TaxID=947516 RepID=UPI001294062D|nr:hypothetical protein D5125_04800 [gamma proteobacterium SS-5]